MADKPSRYFSDDEKAPVVEDSPDVETVPEAISSSGGPIRETAAETSPSRGTYCLPHRQEILFSQDVEFKTSDLPRWKPRVIIDRYRP